jgi:5,10-methenyltetrahydrofolate synthetase
MENSFTGYASPPCYAHELQAGYDGFRAVDPVEQGDVARWRRAQRERLIAARMALSSSEQKRIAREVIAELAQWVVPAAGFRIGVYWPFRGEIDLRGEMRGWHENGACVALPEVRHKHDALMFREWRPKCDMVRGALNIPVPANGRQIIPQAVIAPLVGFDRDAYRLGYGGGCFDRTLAAMTPKPFVIGIGHPLLQLDTIYPQPHDVPMDIIITGVDRVIERPRT